MTPRPHDALIKLALESPADAGPFLRELLPVQIRDAVVWDALSGEPGSFIDAELADRHSDLLFSAPLRNGNKACLYLLMEHQSSQDKTMPLRMLTSEIQIWDRVRKEAPDAPLPPVIAIVLTHAPGGWRSPRTFADMFEREVLAIPGMAALVPQFSLIIEDLAHLSDDDLKARSLGAFQKVALWLLRDARDPVRLLSSFSAWTDAMLQARQAPGGLKAFATLITYMFRVIDPVKRNELRAKLHLLGPHAEESAMSIADMLHKEGLKEGLKRGRKEGRVATLRSLLTLKFGPLDASQEACLRVATSRALDRYLRRVLTADSLAEVLTD
jgi:predicted transposase YdaD